MGQTSDQIATKFIFYLERHSDFTKMKKDDWGLAVYNLLVAKAPQAGHKKDACGAYIKHVVKLGPKKLPRAK